MFCTCANLQGAAFKGANLNNATLAAARFSGASLGGVLVDEVGGKLRLDDAQGNKVSDADLDTAPFLGATFKAKF